VPSSSDGGTLDGVPIDAGSYHFAVGPLIALAVVGLLALALRWTFGAAHPGPARPAAAGTDGEYGLLAEIAVVPSLAEANALRAVLSDAGIRSTAAIADRGRARVLVFHADADLARVLAGQAHFGDD
jgi:hypothetical protein